MTSLTQRTSWQSQVGCFFFHQYLDVLPLARQLVSFVSEVLGLHSLDFFGIPYKQNRTCTKKMWSFLGNMNISLQ